MLTLPRRCVFQTLPCVVLLSHLKQGVRQIATGLECGRIQGERGTITGDGAF